MQQKNHQWTLTSELNHIFSGFFFSPDVFSQLVTELISSHFISPVLRVMHKWGGIHYCHVSLLGLDKGCRAVPARSGEGIDHSDPHQCCPGTSLGEVNNGQSYKELHRTCPGSGGDPAILTLTQNEILDDVMVVCSLQDVSHPWCVQAKYRGIVYKWISSQNECLKTVPNSLIQKTNSPHILAYAGFLPIWTQMGKWRMNN